MSGIFLLPFIQLHYWSWFLLENVIINKIIGFGIYVEVGIAWRSFIISRVYGCGAKSVEAI